jgi:hypothetical protein
MKEVCELQNRGFEVVNYQELIEFFNEQVFSDYGDAQIYASMTAEGFNSIFSFFILLNQNERKILRLLPQNLDTKSSVG